MPLTPSNRRAEESSWPIYGVARHPHGARALPESFAVGRKFATNLCRENGGTLLTCLGVKNLCTLLLTARLSDNLGNPFWQSDCFGRRPAARWRRYSMVWTFRQGLWSTPSSRAMCHFLAF